MCRNIGKGVSSSLEWESDKCVCVDLCECAENVVCACVHISPKHCVTSCLKILFRDYATKNFNGQHDT
jgi:hypothetical protein